MENVWGETMVSLINVEGRQTATCYFCGAKLIKYEIKDAQHIKSCNNPSCYAKLKDYDNLLTQNKALQQQVREYKNAESWRLNPEPPH